MASSTDWCITSRYYGTPLKSFQVQIPQLIAVHFMRLAHRYSTGSASSSK